MSAPTEARTTAQQFQELAARWRQERGPFSTAKRLAAHPAYQAIIAMGQVAVPFILADLEKKPDHWFLALQKITGASPVPESDWGKLSLMAAAWIAWGRAQGVPMVDSQSAWFPNINASNHRITSPGDDSYNCIAWAVGVNNDWWEPVEEHYWPANAPRNYTVAALVKAFESVGFVECAVDDQALKIAIYADADEYMHAARQLDTGKWTSKLGPDEDIEHDTLEVLEGPGYGQVVKFMKKA